MSVRRPHVVGLTAGLLALALGVQTAAAATLISGPTGTTGDVVLQDQHPGKKGARCVYDPAQDYELVRIKVRPPRVYGHYQTKTWVGWRFKILHRDVNVNWHVVFSSSVQKDRASDPIAADDFTWRTWNAPANPSGVYKVRVVIFWYEPGSQTIKEGKVVWEYDWYRVKELGNPGVFHIEHHCLYYIP